MIVDIQRRTFLPTSLIVLSSKILFGGIQLRQFNLRTTPNPRSSGDVALGHCSVYSDGGCSLHIQFTDGD